MRVVLDRGCREIEGLSGRTYASRNAVFDVDPHDVKGIVAIGGAACSLAGTTRRSHGYRCTECGFGSFFKTCGRCGGEGIKE
jgi:hypothetical protein